MHPRLSNRISLGFFPTPLHQLKRLSDHLAGPQIWIKRDDLTGLALGGNKNRKLEYLLFDALQQQCDSVITAGAAQSNHCRQTAAAAAQLGLECHLVLGGQAPPSINGNLLLDQLFGAKVHWAGENRKGEDIPKLVNQLKQQGKKPYVVPYGGSNRLGALGFVNALQELHQQCAESPLSHIIVASSSGATHAGLAAANIVLGKRYQLIGINIDKDENTKLSFADSILHLTQQTLDVLESGKQVFAKDIQLNSDYLGEGYGIVGNAEKQAISLVARLEGIVLDPVYTGRAMAGLIDLVHKGQFSPDDKVLFWHTGGAPALFDYADKIA